MNRALRNKLIELQGWTLVLLLCLSCLLGGVNPQELPEEEMDALQALKRAWSTTTPDFQTTFATWNSSRPCGDLNSSTDSGGWRGVTCDVSSTFNGVTVTKLLLKEMGIVGVLPSDVSKLTNIEYIDLSSNRGLFGPIPKELMQLRNLIELDLSYNIFSGEFPFRSIINGSKLQKLDISSNQLNGTIEEDVLWTLEQLVTLDLSSNKFTSQALDFSKIKKLQSLIMSWNKLRSQAPSISQLQKKNPLLLNLASNKFTSQAPNLSNLIALKYLNISRNKFKGQIPTLSDLASMNKLDLSQNNFTGQAPNVSKMKYLYTLDMSQNGFIGKAPNVSKLNQLKWLDLSQNNFKGDLPKFSSNASDLTHINLSSNHFTEFSSHLWSFLNKLPENLTTLDLSNLNFGGGDGLYSTNLTFPMSLSEIYLDKNKLIGPINVSAILESNMSQTLKIASLKDNMINDIIGHDSTIISFAIGLTKFEFQGNPYCYKTWSSQDETTTCNFYCANTCFKFKQPKKGRSIIIMASSISIVVVVLIIFLVVAGFVFVLHRKQKYIHDLQKKIKEADVNAKKFDYHKLRIATNNFAPEMKLGEGGFGAVYKGILASNNVVAVKQLLLNTNASRDDFVNEVLLISNLQHQNLVALKGYCLNDRQTFLVYEYVDNCDLDKLLLRRQATNKNTSQGLQLWKMRLKICQGVAQGLHYLHTFSQSRIIHRDIKASNILVNENFEAKIADFGLARLIAGSVIETDRCAGTYGYLAPEYVTEGRLSEKADVYSFGVLLLEIVSGMRNRDHRIPEDEFTHLAAWACNLHKQKRLLDMKDPSIIVSEDEVEEVQRVLETAVLCLQNDPTKRPAMILVAAMLVGKANADELPQSDEELINFPGELASEDSGCDASPLFHSSPSASASLASRPACDPEIEVSLSKNGR